MFITDIKTYHEVRDIMDCFNGSDGGVTFASLATILNKMNEDAEKGDKSAVEVLEIVERFANLVRLSTRVWKDQVNKDTSQ